jgi:hypothetical protein
MAWCLWQKEQICGHVWHKYVAMCDTNMWPRVTQICGHVWHNRELLLTIRSYWTKCSHRFIWSHHLGSLTVVVPEYLCHIWPHICVTHGHIFVSHMATYLCHIWPHICVTHGHIFVSHMATYLWHTWPHICVTHGHIFVSHVATYLYHTWPHICVTHAHIFVPFVINTMPCCPNSWLIAGV